MNSIKRALLSILKHKVKTIMLIVALGTISTALFCGISIHGAVTQVETNAMKSIGTEVQLTLGSAKYKSIKSKNVNFEYLKISGSALKQLDSLKYVIAFNHVRWFMAYSNNFKIISKDQTITNGVDNSRNLTLSSVTDTSRLDEFASGTYQIVSGRSITKADMGKYVAIISQDLAQKNNLHISSTISVQDEQDTKINISFTVIGIFKAPPIMSYLQGIANLDPADTIYTDFNSAATIQNYTKFDGFPAYYNDPTTANRAYYYLDSPASISAFEAVATSIPSLEYYKVTTSNDLYKRLTAPVQGTATLSSLMTVILLFAGCLIFGLIIALSLKGRRREFGILLAVGEKKKSVILQVFIEALIPVAIAFCIAVFASGFVSQVLCNKLVSNGAAVVAQQDKENAVSTGGILSYLAQEKDQVFGNFLVDNATPINKADVSVTPTTVGELAGCSLIILLISMLFPLLSILRLSPMRILLKKE